MVSLSGNIYNPAQNATSSSNRGDAPFILGTHLSETEEKTASSSSHPPPDLKT